jgi:hypothetical protein
MVQAGTLFDYLAAFITIVLAIAFADLAVSLHKLLRARRRVKWHPIPLLAALWVLLALLTSFFAIWELTRLDHLSYYQLVWKIAPQFLYFLAASAALPDEVPPEGLDIHAFYLGERRYFYAILFAALLLDTVDGMVSQWDGLVGNPAFLLGFFLPLNLVALAAFATMGWSANKWVHWAGLALLFLVAHLGFSGWAIRGASAVVG